MKSRYSCKFMETDAWNKIIDTHLPTTLPLVKP